MLSGGDEIGRPFIMSKQVPADRLAILRQAFMATMKDPAFLADMEKLGHPVQPLPGEEAEAIVAKMSGASPAVAEEGAGDLRESKLAVRRRSKDRPIGCFATSIAPLV